MPQQAWSKKRERQYEHIRDAASRARRDQLYNEAKAMGVEGGRG